jgi:hypothetical protein
MQTFFSDGKILKHNNDNHFVNFFTSYNLQIEYIKLGILIHIFFQRIKYVMC